MNVYFVPTFIFHLELYDVYLFFYPTGFAHFKSWSPIFRINNADYCNTKEKKVFVASFYAMTMIGDFSFTEKTQKHHTSSSILTFSLLYILYSIVVWFFFFKAVIYLKHFPPVDN